MQKRTNAQLFDAVRDVLDVAMTPYFSDDQIAKVLSEEYADWFTQVAAGSEHDEKKRRDLGALVKQAIPVVTNGKVDLGVLNPLPFRLLAVGADYSDCNENRAVRPLSYDAWLTALRDPWNEPTEREPAYLDGSGQIEILPHPTGVTLIYLIRPRDILATEPESKTEVEYEVQSRIIERAARRLAIAQQNPEAYQTLAAESAGQE